MCERVPTWDTRVKEREMDNKKEMDLTLSDGFMKDLAQILEFCTEQDTDHIETEFGLGVDGVQLCANIVFFVKENS